MKSVVSRNAGSGIFDSYVTSPFPSLLTITASIDFVKNITQHQNVLRLPSDEDLNGAAVALMRLQDTYKLDTHALAEGKMLGKKYSRQLTGNQ